MNASSFSLLLMSYINLQLLFSFLVVASLTQILLHHPVVFLVSAPNLDSFASPQMTSTFPRWQVSRTVAVTLRHQAPLQLAGQRTTEGEDGGIADGEEEEALRMRTLVLYWFYDSLPCTSAGSGARATKREEAPSLAMRG